MLSKLLKIGVYACSLTSLIHGEVVINEFMASNAKTIRDDDGDEEDWIELYNSGDEAVNLQGWGLSDNPSNPFKWTFPDVVIEAGSHLLVWASGKDRISGPSGNFIHTNFSISSSGEPLQLTAADGTVSDQVPAIQLPADVSYGRFPDGGEDWYYYAEATPGATSTGAGYFGFMGEPAFSHDAGFYTEEFLLHLSAADPEAMIIYTTDGSEPREENIGGKTYYYKNSYPQNPGQAFGPLLEDSYQTFAYQDDNPIPIKDRSTDPNKLSAKSTTYNFNPSNYLPNKPVFKGTVVRARVVREGMIPGTVITRSYFVTPTGEGRYDLPVISLSTNEDHLFGYDNGIYTAGVDFDQWRVSKPSSVADYASSANYRRRGDDYEYPIHMEVFIRDKGRVLAQNLGFRMHGGASRMFELKTLRLYAKEEYDNEGWINFPLIPSLVGNGSGLPIGRFKRLLLRNSGNDSRSFFFRDAFIQELMKPMGLDQQGYQPAIHFINGEFWGMINIRERVDRFHLANHHEIDSDEIVILSGNADVSEGSPADAVDYVSLRNFVISQDVGDPGIYAFVADRIDLGNFATYMVAEIYSANRDWPHNNIEYWRSSNVDRSPGALPARDGRWRWIFFDIDQGFHSEPQHNTLAYAAGDGDPPRSATWTGLFKGLLGNSEFRNLFINTFADHLATTLEPSRAGALYDQMKSVIEPYYAEHGARWRLQNNKGNPAVRNFAFVRREYVQQHLIDYFQLQGTADITLDVNDDEAGHLKVNTIEVHSETPGIPDPAHPFPWTATYFQGVPITVTAIAREGFRFVGWEEYPGYESPTIVLDPEEGMTLTALFEPVPESEKPRILHLWTFEEGQVEPPSQSVSGGLIETIPGPFFAEFVVNGSAQGFDSAHLRINRPIGSAVVIQAPTVGYRDITLELLTRRSGQGAGAQV